MTEMGQDRLARIAAEEEKEKRRAARVAAILEKNHAEQPTATVTAGQSVGR
jgi:hypothetical protein